MLTLAGEERNEGLLLLLLLMPRALARRKRIWDGNGPHGAYRSRAIRDTRTGMIINDCVAFEMLDLFARPRLLFLRFFSRFSSASVESIRICTCVCVYSGFFLLFLCFARTLFTFRFVKLTAFDFRSGDFLIEYRYSRIARVYTGCARSLNR